MRPRLERAEPPAHDRRRVQAAEGGVPGRLDLEDPLPRGSGPARASAGRTAATGCSRRTTSSDCARSCGSSGTSSCRCASSGRSSPRPVAGGATARSGTAGRHPVAARAVSSAFDELCERSAREPGVRARARDYGSSRPRSDDGYRESDADDRRALLTAARSYGIEPSQPARDSHGHRPGGRSARGRRRAALPSSGGAQPGAPPRRGLRRTLEKRWPALTRSSSRRLALLADALPAALARRLAA